MYSIALPVQFIFQLSPYFLQVRAVFTGARLPRTRHRHLVPLESTSIRPEADVLQQAQDGVLNPLKATTPMLPSYRVAATGVEVETSIVAVSRDRAEFHSRQPLNGPIARSLGMRASFQTTPRRNLTPVPLRDSRLRARCHHIAIDHLRA